MQLDWIRNLLWLRSIKAIAGLPQTLEDEILKCTPKGISGLAAIAKKYDRKDKKDRAVYRLAIELLLKDPSKIEGAIGKHDDIRAFIAAMILEYAGAIADGVSDTLASRIPDGCSINASSTRRKAVELLLVNANEDKVCFHLIENIRQNPSEFIEGYSNWLNKAADQSFHAVQYRLQESIAKDCTLNVLACRREIIRLLQDPDVFDITESRSSYDHIIGDVFKRINAEPEQYVDGFGALLNNAAENLFKQIKAQVSDSLPKGITLMHGPCVSYVYNLMKQGCEPSEWVENFLNGIKNNPSAFLVDDKQIPQKQFNSSQNHSTGSDHAMLSDASSSSRRGW